MALDVRARYAIEVPDNAYNTIGIDLGDFGYRHPELGFYTRDEDYMKRQCEEKGFDPAQVYFFDSRPTIKEVLQTIREKEDHIWDEYISYSMRYEKDKPIDGKWPGQYNWCAVYVITGGSEGLYLHVDLIYDSGRREMIFVGKSLGHGWEECWLSAARIGAMLNV